MQYVIRSCGLGLLVLFACNTEAAEHSNSWSVRVGYSHLDFDDWGADDPDGHALQVYAGYSVNEWLSAEIGWFDGSRVSGDIYSLPFTIRPDRRTMEPRALMIGPRTRWSFGKGFSVYGMLGYAYTSHFYRLVGGTFATPDYTTGETRHEHEFFYGAGVGYAIDDCWSVQLDYRTLEFSGLPTQSLGLIGSYRFR